MLVKVSVENFKSFDKAAELTMISSNKIRTNANHRLKIKSTQLLKYAVVYGANASGKTNLALFFKFFKDSVCNGIPIEATQMFCKNRQENKERESSFEIQITVGDKFYAYGFSAVLSRRKVTGEWLYELYQNGSAKCLFEREGSKRPVLNDGITLTNTEKNKFETYADDFEGNETSLFLTEMNRGKKYSTRSKLLFFRDVYDWIQNHISIITPDTPLIDLEYYYDDNSLKLINKLIKTFDTGISQVKIEEITLDELSNALPKSVFDKMMQHVKNRMEEQEEPSFRMTMRSKETFFNIEVEGHSEPKVTTIRLHHNKSFYEFGFDEESDGTRRLFDLMDMLLNKREDVLYVVDELERSLHPKLTERFLQLFMQLHDEQRMQLLFTTHESSIMDQAIFRRDEIWFVERNAENASSIDFIDHFDDTFSNLYFYGDTGIGKTFLSNCVAKELMDHGHSVIYFTAFQLFDILSKGVFAKDEEAIAANENIFTCDLLIIDDLGTELTNSFTTSQLFLCLNERILHRKSTIISTNLGLSQLTDLYSERILSRIMDNYVLIKLFGEDIRMQKRRR